MNNINFESNTITVNRNVKENSYQDVATFLTNKSVSNPR